MRRAAAQAGVRHGAQDGGLPAGGPRRGSAGARCRRPAGALGAHRGVHPAGRRHHHGAGRPEHWRTADRAAGRCRMSDLVQRGGGELTGTGAEWTERYARALMNTFGPPKRVLVRGEGVYVWDADGKRYLDLLAGIAVNALGHAHPTLTAAISAQLGTLGHVSNFFATPAQVALAERAQLRADRGGQGRVGVAEGVHRDAGQQVEVTLPIGVPDVRALAPHQHPLGRAEGVHQGAGVPLGPLGPGRGAGAGEFPPPPVRHVLVGLHGLAGLHGAHEPPSPWWTSGKAPLLRSSGSTMVPTPRWVNTSVSTECACRPSTTCACGTPPRTARRQASIFGTIPDSSLGSSSASAETRI